MKNEIKMKIVLVDDEKMILDGIQRSLPDYDIMTYDEPKAVLKYLKDTPCDILIVDQKMPDMTGLELLIEAKKIQGYRIGILLSAFVDKDLLEQMINRDLVSHVIDKPATHEKIRSFIEKSIHSIHENEKETERINSEIQYYKNIVLSHINSLGDVNIITQDNNMVDLIKLLDHYADSKANVLITGESGTGKELFAQWIHYKSRRKGKPFIKVNCSAIPDALFESELFGHEKGAFTGAYKAKSGKFELANEGTLFLDEIGDLPLAQQAKLLRILEDKELTRIGGGEPVKIDVRVICATNKDLEKMIKEEKFREDLYFRLNVLKVHIPSLRERNGDILLLSAYYLNKISNDEGGPEKYLDEEASNYIKTLSFQGNIRELKNFIHRLYLSSRNSVITIQDIKSIDTRDGNNRGLDGLLDSTASLTDFRNQAEISFLKHQLELSGNNVGETAKRLGMTSSNLHRRLKALRITVKEN